MLSWRMELESLLNLPMFAALKSTMLEAVGAGPIVFRDPRYVAAMQPLGPNDESAITPKTGQLLIFPSRACRGALAEHTPSSLWTTRL